MLGILGPGFHHDAGPDERKAHEGTLLYTSRDAHTGTVGHYFLDMLMLC